MKTFGLVNLMPLLKFERVWWNIQSAESSRFLIFPVSDTRGAVVSRNARARTSAHSGQLTSPATGTVCRYLDKDLTLTAPWFLQWSTCLILKQSPEQGLEPWTLRLKVSRSHER